MNIDKLKIEAAREYDNACFRIEPWKEVTHCASFISGADWATELHKQELDKYKKVVDVLMSVVKRYAISNECVYGKFDHSSMMQSIDWKSVWDNGEIAQQAIELAKKILGE